MDISTRHQLADKVDLPVLRIEFNSRPDFFYHIIHVDLTTEESQVPSKIEQVCA